MNWLQTIKDSPNYRRLKDSVQYRYDRKQFLIIAISLGGFLLFMLASFFPLLGHSEETDAPLVIGMLVLSFFFLPFIGYFTYRWLEIFLHIGSYTFCEVVFDQPHTGYRGGAYFTVEFTDRMGNKRKKDTSQMFSSNAEPYFEDYNNQKVLVGYNEETDRLVVIHRLGRENGKL